jgi:hypothetical protein
MGTGSVGGPGPAGATVGGGRGIARWQHNRVLQIFGLGGGALLLLLVGLAMQRRQAVLAASGRRI